MKGRIALSALALVLFASASVSADSAYMPTLQREPLRTMARVHVIWTTPSWQPAGDLEGIRVTIYAEGRKVAWADTTAAGDVVFYVPLSGIVRITIEGAEIRPQEVAVVAEDSALAVAFWVRRANDEGPSFIAANWEQAR